MTRKTKLVGCLRASLWNTAEIANGKLCKTVFTELEAHQKCYSSKVPSGWTYDKKCLIVEVEARGEMGEMLLKFEENKCLKQLATNAVRPLAVLPAWQTSCNNLYLPTNEKKTEETHVRLWGPLKGITPQNYEARGERGLCITLPQREAHCNPTTWLGSSVNEGTCAHNVRLMSGSGNPSNIRDPPETLINLVTETSLEYLGLSQSNHDSLQSRRPRRG